MKQRMIKKSCCEEAAMQDGALRKVTEVPVDTRHAMENIIGRSLGEDEAISINVYKPAPTGQARDEASRRLLARIDKTAQRAQGASEGKIDAAIDEAVDHVRHDPE
jgi:hypothetical protein